jgi:hypothetical protein
MVWVGEVTAYVPGASVTRYRPFSFVCVRATLCPFREKNSHTCFAGFVHGMSSLQTGYAGSISTTPHSPLFVAAPAAVPARTSAMVVVTRILMFRRFPVEHRL